MSKEEIEDGNKLIAAFMKDEFIYNDAIDGFAPYNLRWDYLMPVVEKISLTGLSVEIVPSGYVKISGLRDTSIFKNVIKAGSLINAVWLAVVYFVEWYNKNVPSPYADF